VKDGKPVTPNLAPPTFFYYTSKTEHIKLMAKQIIVEKRKFDAVLAELLKTPPLPMKKVKTAGKRTSKSVIPPQSAS
jgi:hypothetical protein